MTRKLDPEYAKLSFLSAVLFRRADVYLHDYWFVAKLRAHSWDLTPELVAAWKTEAIKKGVPKELLEPTLEEITIANSPEWFQIALGLQKQVDQR